MDVYRQAGQRLIPAVHLLQKTSQNFKQAQPDVKIVHVLDAGFDGDDLFIFIDKELEDEFVIRLSSTLLNLTL